MHRSLLHRWTCYCSRGSSLSRHISSSSKASLLRCCPPDQPQNWQRRHAADWQSVLRPNEAFSIRHFGSRRGSKVIRAIDYTSLDDLLRDSCDILNSGGLLPTATAAVWARSSRLLSDKRQVASNLQLEQQVDQLFIYTMDSLNKLNHKELSTIILSIAKIAKTVKKAKQKSGYHLAFGKLLLDEESRPIEGVFDLLAIAADRILPHSDSRSLSNIAYAYALIEYNPQLDGLTLLRSIGDKSIGFIDKFNGRDTFNIVWAFATLNVEHPALFQTVDNRIDDLELFRSQSVADIVWAYASLGIVHPGLFAKVGTHIKQLDNLQSFNPQVLTNIVWAFATVGVQQQALFDKVGDHINQLDSLKSFPPQALAKIVWAYAAAFVGVQQRNALFKRVGDHIIASDNLESYKAQDFSNIVWAYATAGVQRSALFKKIGYHIVALDSLEAFNPQDLSNIVWAYANAGMQHSTLFEKIGDHIVTSDHLKSFNPQEISNTVRAYANANELRSDLFETIGIAVANRGDFQSFTDQDLADMAWAYTVANADAPMLFNDTFISALIERQHRFITEHLYQLHQWHLWQNKELSHAGLPDELRERCYQAFAADDATVSRLQKDVSHELKSMDLHPVEEYTAPSGYSIDALVEVDGRRIGIEVDGPSHFIKGKKKPTATTLLKRRQITAIDKVRLVSVPYWEWNKLGKGRVKKQQYLRTLIGI
ncbi:hypothetical protein ACHAXN_001169 [Cyclotella atomus]